MHTRRFQRHTDIDALEIVMTDAADLEPAVGARFGDDFAGDLRQRAARRLTGYRQGPAPAQVIGRQRSMTVAQLGRCAVEDDLAAALARARTHIDDAVRLEHDLRVVFDHQQRIAGIAQPLHDGDHALHVARMQSDRRLIEHEQRVHQRGAQRRGQIDALDFTAGQSTRLPVEGQVGQADIAKKAGAAAQLIEQQIGGLVQRRR